jgi:hypothetical protein
VLDRHQSGETGWAEKSLSCVPLLGSRGFEITRKLASEFPVNPS